MLFLLLASLNGCKKEVDSMGLNLRDDLLGAEFTDTTTLQAYSLIDDSINTTRSYPLLGMLNDPVFGQTKASVYTQFSLPGELALNSGCELDSVVLLLSYSGDYMGDITQPVSIKVYRLSEHLDNTKTYYNFSNVDHNGINLTYAPNFQVYYSPTQKVILSPDTFAPHLRIRLVDYLGLELMQNLSSTATFRELLKGLCIEANSAGNSGCMGYFRMDNELSGLMLYYHTIEAGKVMPHKYKFTTDIASQGELTYFTRFTHDYNHSSDPQIKQMMLSGDHAIGKQVLYLQGNAGIKTKIEFPHLVDAFKGKNIVINRAELVITNMLPDETSLKSPDRLTLFYIDESGKSGFMSDNLYLDDAFFGGTYDKNKQEYRFRITHHLRNILTGRMPNNGIYLTVTNPATNSSRLKFYGTESIDLSKRLRLELSYTVY